MWLGGRAFKRGLCVCVCVLCMTCVSRAAATAVLLRLQLPLRKQFASHSLANWNKLTKTKLNEKYSPKMLTAVATSGVVVHSVFGVTDHNKAENLLTASLDPTHYAPSIPFISFIFRDHNRNAFPTFGCSTTFPGFGLVSVSVYE